MDRDDLIRDKVVEWLSNETTLLEVECEAAGDGLMSLIAPELEKAEKWDALTKKYPHFCTRFDPEIDGEVKDETK
jgi:hypothetical protein